MAGNWFDAVTTLRLFACTYVVVKYQSDKLVLAVTNTHEYLYYCAEIKPHTDQFNYLLCFEFNNNIIW